MEAILNGSGASVNWDFDKAPFPFTMGRDAFFTLYAQDGGTRVLWCFVMCRSHRLLCESSHSLSDF
jgi:hypothetical protein